MSEELFRYDLNDLLNFDLEFELDIPDCSSSSNPSKGIFADNSSLHQPCKEATATALRKKHPLEGSPESSFGTQPLPPSPSTPFSRSVPADSYIHSTDIPNDSKRLKISSVNIASTKKRTLPKTGKKVIPPLKQPPPPIPRNDARYSYTRLLLNALNSCDPVKLSAVLTNYTTEDMVSIHRYEVSGDVQGRNSSRFDGRQASLQMWIGLFKSAPDFFFDVLDTRAFHSPDWNVIIASKFEWVGTRVSDVSVTRPADHDRNLQRRISGSSDCPNQDEELHQELHHHPETQTIHNLTSQVLSVTNISHSTEEGLSDSSRSTIERQRKVVLEPLFLAKEECVILKGEDFMLESKPCDRKEMRCSGRILLHLNHENKIFKIEFIYTSSSEAESKVTSLRSGKPDITNERSLNGGK